MASNVPLFGLGVLIGAGVTVLFMSRTGPLTPDVDQISLEPLVTEIQAVHRRLDELAEPRMPIAQERSRVELQAVDGTDQAPDVPDDLISGTEIVAELSEIKGQIANLLLELGSRAGAMDNLSRFPANPTAVQQVYDSLAPTNPDVAAAKDRWVLVSIPTLIAELGKPSEVSGSGGRIMALWYTLSDESNDGVVFRVADGMVSTVYRED